MRIDAAIGARFFIFGAAAIRVQLADGEIFQDALFDFFEVVMVFVENFAHIWNIEIVFGELAPRQVHEPIEIRFDDVIFGGGGRHGLHAVQFAPRFFFRLFGHSGFGNLFVVACDFGFLLAAFAQLFLNLFQLLAQDVFALIFFNLLLCLPGNLFAEFQAHPPLW